MDTVQPMHLSGRGWGPRYLQVRQMIMSQYLVGRPPAEGPEEGWTDEEVQQSAT